MSVLDIRRLERDHGKFIAAHHQAVSSSAEEAAKAGEKLSKQRPGFTPRRPHGAASKTKGRVIRRRGKVVRVELRNTAKHSRILEKGSRPHLIAARPFKTLRFKGRGGQWVFRKAVRHPGTPAYKFLSKGRDAASRKFEQVMRPRMSRISKSF